MRSTAVRPFALVSLVVALALSDGGCQKRRPAADDDDDEGPAATESGGGGVPSAGAGSGSGSGSGVARPRKRKGQRAYGASADELKALWEEILVAAQKDERQKVHDLLAPLVLTEAEVRALLGDEAGRQLWPRYRAMTETLINRGAVELVGQVYERKYDDIQVVAVDPATASRDDRALLDALVEPLQLYAVRVKKKGDNLGLRYDGFFFRDGRWRTWNQLGKILAAQTPARRDGGQ
jgi:hypothetical protein